MIRITSSPYVIDNNLYALKKINNLMRDKNNEENLVFVPTLIAFGRFEYEGYDYSIESFLEGVIKSEFVFEDL